MSEEKNETLEKELNLVYDGQHKIKKVSNKIYEKEIKISNVLKKNIKIN